MGCRSSKHRDGDFSDEGIKDVSKLHFPQNVSNLHLYGNLITDVSKLGPKLSDRLVQLELSDNKIKGTASLSLSGCPHLN